jgi:DNA sulfur modification protein DndB
MMIWARGKQAVLDNIDPADELRGLAGRKAKPDDFKSVRHALVDEEIRKGWMVRKRSKTTTRLGKAKTHDKHFEDRVWSLLYRMGFQYLSAQGGAFLLVNPNEPKGPDNQIDVVAIDDEVAFAMECKSSESPRRFADFSKDLAKHVGLRERFTRAVREQFPSPNKRPSIFAIWCRNIGPSENDEKRAIAENVSLLDEKDLEYYEQLIGQVGTAARFQFLADLLGGRVVPGLELTVPAIRSKVGGGVAYSFSVSPEYLLKIAFVSHRAKGKASDIDAYQRLLKRSRLKSIRQYITDGGFFPTNIVVNIADTRWLTFDRGQQQAEKSSQLFGWLHIRPAYRVAWIIDGQHRLFAYANHPLAKRSLIAVMAFVGLEPSEQARLFVDINAEQRKVKQSLLQELYAELHWDAAEADVRVQAILSKVIQVLDADKSSPFHGRILKADETRTEARCISLTSVFHAMERGGFFIARMKKGEVVEFGPLWAVKNEATLKRTAAILIGYFDFIRSEAANLWTLGSGEGGGLSMNDGVTVCINVLRSIFYHLQNVKRIALATLGDNELVELIEPWARMVGKLFASFSPEQMAQFRALRGVQGQTAGTRRVEEAVRRVEPNFDPPGLKEFLEREKAQTTNRAYEEITKIEKILQTTVLSELRNEFGPNEEDWWFSGVPKDVRKKVDDRINEEAGKSGGREQNFDLIDYRNIMHANWPLFEGTLARGKGSKDSRTKWLVEVNELRKRVMHASKGQSLPITEEQLALLEEIYRWLEGKVGSQVDD